MVFIIKLKEKTTVVFDKTIEAEESSVIFSDITKAGIEKEKILPLKQPATPSRAVYLAVGLSSAAASGKRNVIAVTAFSKNLDNQESGQSY